MNPRARYQVRSGSHPFHCTGYYSFPLEIRDVKIYQPPDTSIGIPRRFSRDKIHLASAMTVFLPRAFGLDRGEGSSTGRTRAQVTERRNEERQEKVCLEIRDGKRKIEAMVRSLVRNTSRRRRTQPHISQAPTRSL